MERQREIRICSKHGETEFALEKSGRWRCLKCQVEATQKRRNKVKESTRVVNVLSVDMTDVRML